MLLAPYLIGMALGAALGAVCGYLWGWTTCAKFDRHLRRMAEKAQHRA